MGGKYMSMASLQIFQIKQNAIIKWGEKEKVNSCITFSYE